MSLKYLCHSYEDVQKLGNEEIEFRVRASGLEYPLVVILTGENFKATLSSPSGRIMVKTVFEAENYDEYLPLDVRDTQIVHLRSIADAQKLCEETVSWSHKTFQIPSELIERPYFIVSYHTRFRWYNHEYEAREVAPWAKVITIDKLPPENYLGSLAELLI